MSFGKFLKDIFFTVEEDGEESKENKTIEELSQIVEEDGEEKNVASLDKLEKLKEKKKSLEVSKSTLSADDCCDQLVDSTYQMQEIKTEYEMVTAYLTDIQIIEQADKKEKMELCEQAEKILRLTKDREGLVHSNERLTNSQYQFIQLHESEIPEVIDKIAKAEEYDNVIQADMQNLEKEQAKIKQDKKEAKSKMDNLFLTTFSLVLMALILVLILVFLSRRYYIDMGIGYLLVAFFVALFGTMLYMRYRKCNYILALSDKKYNKSINLMNKVKVKCVYNTNSLDYLYNKYHVNSGRELSYLWEQYLYVLEEEKRMQRFSKDLSYWSSELSKGLSKLGVRDTEVWTYQAEAIMDSKEMVEVTHNLNVRRQKLREQLEYCESIYNLALDTLKQHIKEDDSIRDYAVTTLSPYRITID